MIAVMVGLDVVVLIWWVVMWFLGVAMCCYVVGWGVVALRFVVVIVLLCDLRYTAFGVVLYICGG